MVNKLFGINYLLLFFLSCSSTSYMEFAFPFYPFVEFEFINFQGHQINNGMTGVTTAEENDAIVHVQLSPHDCMRAMRNVVLQVDDVLCVFGGIQ